MWDHVLDEVLGDNIGVTGVRIKNVQAGATSANSPLQGCSSPSATGRTRRSSPASST